MVVNDSKEFHMVTPVAYEIKEPRLSIQIFGGKYPYDQG